MALQGIRVLDLTRLLPGPFATWILADLGAEVIKIEDTGEGDYFRTMGPLVNKQSAYYLSINRNKKSIRLNLKNEHGKEAFFKLVDTADVLVEGLRPGVMEKLGLGYNVLAKRNPKLIYCAITGYGLTGPYRAKSGHDINYIALAGALGITGRAGSMPTIPGVQVADLGGGALFGVSGILAALVGRQKTGKGQLVDISMMDGILSWLAIHIAATRSQGGPEPLGEMLLSGGVVCYNVYETLDKRYMALGALETKFWTGFCRLIGREDLLDHAYKPAKAGEWAFDEVARVFRSKTFDQWTELLKDVDVCCEPVLNLDEVLNHPQAVARNMSYIAEHPTEGPWREIGCPIKLSDSPARHQRGAPMGGQDTEQILGELGYSREQINSLRESGVI